MISYLAATPGFRIFIKIGKLVCKPALSCSFRVELMAPWQSLSWSFTQFAARKKMGRSFSPERIWTPLRPMSST
ncbi:hypothetical protein, partial [Prosthecobacter sp.]|uniref:hypothetical protein n=1 Tax=Prosthecobacter sp. TaxID=1965333 RepID=UPI0025FD6B42